jgi:photosystem II stability/assembly factor-like uncharacterized protein
VNRRTVLKLSMTATAAVGTAAVGYLAAPQVVRAGMSSQVARTEVFLARPMPASGSSLTLRRAWQSALQQGRLWSANAAIVSLSSRDQQAAGVSTEAANAGAKGARAVWEAVLVAPDKPSLQLLVRVANGVTVQSVADPRTLDLPPIARAPVLDSSDVATAAQAAQPALAPGSGKSRGYSFTLSTAQDGQVVLAVIGSIRGMPARADFDAVTGKKIDTSVFAFVKSLGGVMYSTDAGQSWQASNLTGGQIQQIAAVPGQSDAAYAVQLTQQGPQIAKTIDGGRSWSQVGSLPANTGAWATDLTVVPQASGHSAVAVGAPSGLWLSTDGGTSWAHDASLPMGTVQWLAAAGKTLLASLASINSPAPGVYAATDLGHWQRLLPATYRLSTLTDGQTAIALNDSGNTAAYIIKGTATAPLTLSIPALRVAGTTVPGQSLLADSAREIALSLDGGRTWATTLRTNSTSVAVGSASSGASIALVGGYRTGIFRSSNHGRAWQQVVRAASSILPGSDEITSLTFVTPNHVVAVQGGIQQWQSI